MYTAEIMSLLAEMYSDADVLAIRAMSKGGAFDRDAFKRFDQRLGGPSVLTIADPDRASGTLNIPGHGSGRYTIGDRGIFRPLQYCAAYLENDDETLQRSTRSLIRDASAHIEALLKRVDGPGAMRRTLGALLRSESIIKVVDRTTHAQALRFSRINNAAKHEYDHEKDTHMFSLEDALASYFICRRIALRLYPLARLTTNMAVFEVEPVHAWGEHDRSRVREHDR